MQIKEKALRNAINTLNALNAKFKVIAEDGKEYGDLKVLAEKKCSRRNGLFAKTGYIEKVQKMKAGDVVVFSPPDGVMAKEMQGPVSARANAAFGPGNYQTCIANNEVQLLRIA